MSAADRNLKKLEKVIAVHEPSNHDSFHMREATKPLLTKPEAKKMVALANQRLRKGDLEELFGVTLQDQAVVNIPVVKHSSLHLEMLLGHGQFHAVYDLKDEQSGGGGGGHGHNRNVNMNKRKEKLVVKTLRPKLQRHMTTARQISTGAADLVKEALLLQCLQSHSNIIDLKGWSGDGLSGFSNGTHDGFFLVLPELSTTLKDKLVVGGDWKDEDLFLQDRLGHESYAYGYYYYHDRHIVVETPKEEKTPKKKGFFASLFGSPSHHSHHGHEDPNLHYRSPAAHKALLDKQHSFFCTRLQRCIEMADALSYMHQLRILHRDLKPANVGFMHYRSRQTLKVFDMDMSRVIPRNKNGSDDPNMDVYPMLTQQVGSRRYIGPEVARSEAYNLKSDVYSFGLIVYEMLSFHKPYAEFEAMSEAVHDNHNDGVFFDGPASLDEAILVEGRLRPLLPRAQWDKDVCDFVEECWSQDMHVRPTMKEALVRLKEIHARLSSKDCDGMVPATDKNQVCDMNDRTHKSIDSSTKKSETASAELNIATGPTIVTLPPKVARPTVAATVPTTAKPTEPMTRHSSDDSSASSSTTPPEASPEREQAMKKSSSWCSLVSLGMVDQEESTDEDDEHFEEGDGVEQALDGKSSSMRDEPFTV